MSPGYHAKEPNIAQLLNYFRSYTCLQELKRISNYKDQAVECKNQDGIGVSCAKKGPTQKGQVPQKNNYACRKEFNHSEPHPAEEKVLFEHEFTLLHSLVEE